jgi:hypothetical protein
MSGDWAPVIGISVIVLSVSAVTVLRGPVGKALAQWISGWSHTEARWIEAKSLAEGAGTSAGAAEVEQLRQEVDELRGQLTDVQERLDFTERMLARSRDADRLAPPR